MCHGAAAVLLAPSPKVHLYVTGVRPAIVQMAENVTLSPGAGAAGTNVMPRPVAGGVVSWLTVGRVDDVEDEVSPPPPPPEQPASAKAATSHTAVTVVRTPRCRRGELFE